MKKTYTIAMAVLALTSLKATAQTLHVEMGSVTYQMTAEQAGVMTYHEGRTVNILDKDYLLSDITQMYFDDAEVTDASVSVVYDDAAARVTVSGDVARYLTVSVDGAHVSVSQSDDLDREITYTLSGSSADGSFYMDGSYKATVELAGLALTNPSGAAVNIQNGKRIDISVKKDTENSLIDGAQGSQKACLWVKGHAEFKGKGVLNVSGKTAHAIKTGEYATMKNCTIHVLEAVGDGFHVNEYFLIESGTLTISNTGDDALQAEIDGTTSTGETDGHEDEDSGNIYIEGGTLVLDVTAAGAKCMKSDGLVRVNDGSLALSASGNVDTSDASDPSYSTGIKAASFVQDGGSITLNIKGVAGRGISATDIETNGGELTIENSGAPRTISSDVKSAKGLNALNVALNAGTISITMTGNAGKGIKAGDGTKSTSGGGGGGWRPGGGGGMGGGTTYTNVQGSYTQGKADGTGPVLTVKTTGSAYSSSSAKAIKAICAITIYGGQTEVSTKTSGAEGLESKTSVDIKGGQHYFQCYDDCINSIGMISFNGGVTVCYSNGNDAVDSNYGKTGAVTIGDGTVFAFTTRGAPEEGLDCDNNSYIQIKGKGIAISAGASQGGGGGWGGGSSGNTISNAAQGYAFVTSSINYSTGRYYTLADAQGQNLVTYSFPASCNSSLALFTATGMVKGSSYNIKYGSTEPEDAATVWHGLYLGSSHQGTTSVTSFTAK